MHKGLGEIQPYGFLSYASGQTDQQIYSSQYIAPPEGWGKVTWYMYIARRSDMPLLRLRREFPYLLDETAKIDISYTKYLSTYWTELHQLFSIGRLMYAD